MYNPFCNDKHECFFGGKADIMFTCNKHASQIIENTHENAYYQHRKIKYIKDRKINNDICCHKSW